MIVAIHQPDYLPHAGFFYKISQSDIFVILENVQFKKGGYHNRTKIKTDKGAKWLTIPVVGNFGQTIEETKIDNCYWWYRHLNVIKDYYGKDNKLIWDLFKDTNFENNTLLSVATKEMIRRLMDMLMILRPVFESCGKNDSSGTDRLISICRKVGADTYLSGPSGRKYLEMDKFEKAGIKVMFSEYTTPKYTQRYGEFIPGLSIIDMIANVGVVKTRELIMAGGKLKWT